MEQIQTTNKLIQLMNAQAEFRSYMGGYYKMLIPQNQTQGSFALLEMTLPQGAEPPRHVHTFEDESFYLLDGEVSFFIGEEKMDAKVGQAIFAPRLVPHHFHILTPTATLLTLITPGNFAAYFEEFSETTALPQIQPPQGPPPMEFIQFMTSKLGASYGVHFI